MARILLGVVVMLAAAIGLAVRFLPWWGGQVDAVAAVGRLKASRVRRTPAVC